MSLQNIQVGIKACVLSCTGWVTVCCEAKTSFSVKSLQMFHVLQFQLFSLQWGPYLWKEEVGNVTIRKGMCIDLLEAVASHLNFRF